MNENKTKTCFVDGGDGACIARDIDCRGGVMTVKVGDFYMGCALRRPVVKGTLRNMATQYIDRPPGRSSLPDGGGER